jgi:hypothetical protein
MIGFQAVNPQGQQGFDSQIFLVRLNLLFLDFPGSDWVYTRVDVKIHLI